MAIKALLPVITIARGAAPATYEATCSSLPPPFLLLKSNFLNTVSLSSSLPHEPAVKKEERCISEKIHQCI